VLVGSRGKIHSVSLHVPCSCVPFQVRLHQVPVSLNVSGFFHGFETAF
jgi:hypothetical protein